MGGNLFICMEGVVVNSFSSAFVTEETGVIPSVGLKSSSGGEKGPLGRFGRFAFWLSPPLQIEAPQGTDPCLSGSPLSPKTQYPGLARCRNSKNVF